MLWKICHVASQKTNMDNLWPFCTCDLVISLKFSCLLHHQMMFYDLEWFALSWICYQCSYWIMCFLIFFSFYLLILVTSMNILTQHIFTDSEKCFPRKHFWHIYCFNYFIKLLHNNGCTPHETCVPACFQNTKLKYTQHEMRHFLYYQLWVLYIRHLEMLDDISHHRW